MCCPGAVTFQPTITKTYNTSNLLEDIKGLYKLAGLKGQKVLNSTNWLVWLRIAVHLRTKSHHYLCLLMERAFNACCTSMPIPDHHRSRIQARELGQPIVTAPSDTR